MRNQSGFTMIELVVVIVILGILAAVAVPKFVDLSSEAAVAAADGIKGGIDSASAVNYAAFLGSDGSKGQSIGAAGTNATNCSEAVTALLQDVDPGISNLSSTNWVVSTDLAGQVKDCSFDYEGENRTSKIILTSN